MSGKQINKLVVKKLWSTPEPKKVVALAARMTYSNIDVDQLADNLSEDEIHRSFIAVLERRHLSVFRHVSYMFAISGVSRALSHQLVRHTAGHNFEQRSQHYRKEKQFNYVVPETIDMEDISMAPYFEAMDYLDNIYNQLIACGIPKEDARFVLPNACETQLVWTANVEALINFIKTRACSVNTDEIKRLAVAVRKILLVDMHELAPFLGPTCLTTGICYEGKKYHTHCNRPWADAVLWNDKFPQEIEYISNKKEREKVIKIISNI